MGVLAANALPRYVNLGGDARAATINGLAGSVRSALGLVRALTAVRGIGVAGAQIDITWVDIDATTPVRLWVGYPDRWCDGIGMALQGAVVPSGGCYRSAAPVPFGNFTFYGFGNAVIPNGDAGWRIENAPDPTNCSVAYRYGGVGEPQVLVYTGGC